MGARYFELHRTVDRTGVSGVGTVADGVVYDTPTDLQFADGTRVALPAGWALLRWRPEPRSTGMYRSADEVVQIHGHEGATELVWVEAPARPPEA
jgi:hypothetical protein